MGAQRTRACKACRQPCSPPGLLQPPTNRYGGEKKYSRFVPRMTSVGNQLDTGRREMRNHPEVGSLYLWSEALLVLLVLMVPFATLAAVS